MWNQKLVAVATAFLTASGFGIALKKIASNEQAPTTIRVANSGDLLPTVDAALLEDAGIVLRGPQNPDPIVSESQAVDKVRASYGTVEIRETALVSFERVSVTIPVWTGDVWAVSIVPPPAHNDFYEEGLRAGKRPFFLAFVDALTGGLLFSRYAVQAH